MPDHILARLTSDDDRIETAPLSAAYESAVRTLSAGLGGRLPDRGTRLILVEAMLREGRRNGFDSARLQAAALAALQPAAADQDAVPHP